jgi:hypothetical protein
MNYSFTKGFWKAVKKALSFALLVAVFFNLAENNIWDLVVHYIKPILETMTIGGVITLALNFIKTKDLAGKLGKML